MSLHITNPKYPNPC